MLSDQVIDHFDKGNLSFRSCDANKLASTGAVKFKEVSDKIFMVWQMASGWGLTNLRNAQLVFDLEKLSFLLFSYQNDRSTTGI